MIKRTAVRASDTKALRWLAGLMCRGEWRTDTLRVVTYHRVAEPNEYPDLSPTSLSTTPSQFGKQLDFFSRNYNIVSIDKVLHAWQNGGKLAPRSLLITFDDAYEDFAKHAWPQLRRRGLPVVLFVATAYPDCPVRSFWWDRLHHAINRTTQTQIPMFAGVAVPILTASQRLTAFRQWQHHLKQIDHDQAINLVNQLCGTLGETRGVNHVLSWQELRRLDQEGVAIAPHTQTHPLMNRISHDQAKREIVGSLDDIRREIGHCCPVFAYPSGNFDRSHSSTLRRAGIQLAFTMRRGINRSRESCPLELRRNNVGRNTTPTILSTRWLTSSLIDAWRG